MDHMREPLFPGDAAEHALGAGKPPGGLRGAPERHAKNRQKTEDHHLEDQRADEHDQLVLGHRVDGMRGRGTARIGIGEGVEQAFDDRPAGRPVPKRT